MKEIEKKDAPEVSGGIRDIYMPVLPGPISPWPIEPFPPFPMTPYNPDAPYSDPPAV